MRFPRFARLFFLGLWLAFGDLPGGWSALVNLSNDRLELTVDPAIARVVRLALPGGENLLWTTREPEVVGAWANWGGDKLWWGPQIDWSSALPKVWPPDTVIDGPWRLLGRTQVQVTMASVVSPWAGIRAHRNIKLVADSAHVVIDNAFTRELARTQRVALWSITQIRHPLWCWLESRPHADEPSYVNLWKGSDPCPYVRFEADTNCVRVTRGDGRKFMIGTRGSWLAAVYPKVILVERVSPYPDGQYAEQVSLQLYVCKLYTELETLGGLYQPALGASITNTVEWWVFERPEGLADAALVAWIRAQLTQPPRPGGEVAEENQSGASTEEAKAGALTTP